MGSESSNSDSNSSRSDSDSASNSGSANGELEKMIFLKENENTIINRVWIIKQPISYLDARVGNNPLNSGLSFFEKIKDHLNGILFVITVGGYIMLQHWVIL